MNTDKLKSRIAAYSVKILECRRRVADIEAKSIADNRAPDKIFSVPYEIFSANQDMRNLNARIKRMVRDREKLRDQLMDQA